MKKILFLGLLLVGLLIVYGCVPSDGGLPGEENAAIAGLAISMGCQTYSRGVTSCTTNADGSISVATRTRNSVTSVTDSCRSGVAYDYSCIPGKAGGRSIAYKLCRTQCESAEDCVNAQCLSRCGNGRIDAGETCGTCAADVLCADGEVCQEGICAVPCTPSTEVCDGIDNNCDSFIDENVCTTNQNCGLFGNDCALGKHCEESVCVLSCVPTPEVCDARDNSCNGIVDEEGVCNTAENCGTFGNACTAGQVCSGDVCTAACTDTDPSNDLTLAGTVTLASGVNQADQCSGLYGVRQVNCRTIGTSVDIDLGPRQVCPSEATCGNGACRLEICDGIDNTANGQVDEGCDDDNDDYCDGRMEVVGTPTVCPNGGGDCNDGTSSYNPEATELCFDEGDNNCNAVSNEGCLPYFCSDSDPENNVELGGTLTITAATGEMYSYTSSYSDACIGATSINQSRCALTSSSTWWSLLAPVGIMSCPAGTTCSDSDGIGPAGAVCS